VHAELEEQVELGVKMTCIGVMMTASGKFKNQVEM